MSKFIIKGHLCFCESINNIKIIENGYLVCIDGVTQGVFSELPDGYNDFEFYDFTDKLVLPGMIDLHIHAPQYAFRGLGMDMQLLEWLQTQAFPEEAKYSDLDYAEQAYSIFADDLKKSATTRACIFATLHVPATELLMELMDKTGLKTLVGKVNMDRNSPDYLIEDTDDSFEKTEQWINNTLNKFKNSAPILTPRFIPSCTDELLEKIKQLQIKYKLPLQSHLSENLSEIEWVKQLCPDSDFYGDAYDRFNLFGRDSRTVMAHCVHSSDDECLRMRDNGVFVAHCPESNEDLSSGIAPIRRYIDMGIKVGLGTDVAGGFSESIFHSMIDAIQTSKLRWIMLDNSLQPLNFDEVFYLATKGGGEFFGKVGSFEKGFETDAIVIDDSSLPHPQQLSPRQRLERVVYLSDNRNIYSKFVAGEKIF